MKPAYSPSSSPDPKCTKSSVNDGKDDAARAELLVECDGKLDKLLAYYTRPRFLLSLPFFGAAVDYAKTCLRRIFVDSLNVILSAEMPRPQDER